MIYEPSVVTCDEVIKSCDKAIQAKNETIEKYKQAEVQSEQALKDTTIERDQAKDKLSAWYHNPIYLIGIGVIGGFILNNQVRK